MFGFKYKKIIKEQNKSISDLKNSVTDVGEKLLELDHQIYTNIEILKKEVHGTQVALYSLIDSLDKDLKLDSKGKIKVVKRSKR